MEKKAKNGMFDLIREDISIIQDSIKDIDSTMKSLGTEIVFETIFYRLGDIVGQMRESSARLKMNSNVLIEEKNG
jgi:hypothetical protein